MGLHMRQAGHEIRGRAGLAACPDACDILAAAAGATAGSTQPLDSMTGGQVTSVSTSELSSTQRTGGLVGQRESTNSFKPLSGRKLKM